MKEEQAAKNVSATSIKESCETQADQEFSALQAFNFKMVVRSKEQVLFKHPSGHSSIATYAFPRDTGRLSKREFKDIKVGDSLSFSFVPSEDAATHTEVSPAVHPPAATSPMPAPNTAPQRKAKTLHQPVLIPSRMKKRKQVRPSPTTPSPSLFTKQLYYQPIKNVYDLKDSGFEKIKKRRKLSPAPPESGKCDLSAQGIKLAAQAAILPNLKKRTGTRSKQPATTPLLSLLSNSSFSKLLPKPSKHNESSLNPNETGRSGKSANRIKQENESIQQLLCQLKQSKLGQPKRAADAMNYSILLNSKQPYTRPYTGIGRERFDHLIPEGVVMSKSSLKVRKDSHAALRAYQNQTMSPVGNKTSIMRKNDRAQVSRLKSLQKPQGAYVLQDMRMAALKNEGSLSSMLQTHQCFKSDNLIQARIESALNKTGGRLRIGGVGGQPEDKREEERGDRTLNLQITSLLSPTVPHSMASPPDFMYPKKKESKKKCKRDLHIPAVLRQQWTPDQSRGQTPESPSRYSPFPNQGVGRATPERRESSPYRFKKQLSPKRSSQTATPFFLVSTQMNSEEICEEQSYFKHRYFPQTPYLKTNGPAFRANSSLSAKRKHTDYSEQRKSFDSPAVAFSDREEQRGAITPEAGSKESGVYMPMFRVSVCERNLQSQH